MPKRTKPTIPDWPARERPRERFYAEGGEALADGELLALLLGTGAEGRTAVDLARELIAEYGSLSGLAARSVKEVTRVKGVGLAKAVRLGAAFELSRRLQTPPDEKLLLGSPERVAAYYAPKMEHLKKEVFRVALLDSQNGLIRDVRISEGTLSASLVHPREVFKEAITESAASLILVHNHPSGDPSPSREDLQLTRQLVECGKLLQLRVHDHVIIGRGRHVSLAERGAL
ncbi:MAG: DNA repair protein RadC [Candidatus Rokubacteria bacterium]|nr:DNA repair protein RadC [Candidatus Rokubacteria bacterium]